MPQRYLQHPLQPLKKHLIDKRLHSQLAGLQILSQVKHVEEACVQPIQGAINQSVVEYQVNLRF